MLLAMGTYAQNITKTCKTCNKPISQCTYKGHHPSPMVHVDKTKFLTDYSNIKIGDYFYIDGTYSHNLESGKTAVGVVFSTQTSEKDKLLGFHHGYIMALKDSKKGRCSWGPEETDIPIIPNYDEYKVEDARMLIKDIEGLTYSNDANIKRSSNNSFAFVRSSMPNKVKNTSGWFVPSVGQWVLFLQNICKTKVEIRPRGYSHYIYFDMNVAKPYLKKYGISYDEDYECYWTSNECSDIHAQMIVFSTDQDTKIYYVNKATTRMRTRGIAAF